MKLKNKVFYQIFCGWLLPAKRKFNLSDSLMLRSNMILLDKLFSIFVWISTKETKEKWNIRRSRKFKATEQVNRWEGKILIKLIWKIMISRYMEVLIIIVKRLKSQKRTYKTKIRVIFIIKRKSVSQIICRQILIKAVR